MINIQRKLLKDSINLNFAQIYSQVGLSSLLNTYSIIYFSQFNFIVNNYQNIFNYAEKIIGKKLFFKLLEQTFAKQFLSGKNLEQSKTVANLLSLKGFKLMTTNMAEYLGSKPDDAFYEANLRGVLEGINLVNEKYISDYFVAIKFTALIDHDSLLSANKFSFLVEDFFNENYNFEHPQYGKSITKEQFFLKFPQFFQINTNESELEELWTSMVSSENDMLYYFQFRVSFSFFNIYNPKVSETKIFQKINIFAKEEKRQIEQGVLRLKQILDQSVQHESLYLITDAEQSYLQNAICNLTEQFQLLYNTNKPKFLNTFQCYLRNSIDRIEVEINKKNYFGDKYPIAIKLVRGAYMTEEREVEKQSQRRLIFDTKEDTDANYDELTFQVLKNLNINGKFIVASHNNTSVYKVMDYIEYQEKQESKDLLQKQVFFATLYGLNDFLSYQCLYSGYQTIKLLSYGDNEVTIPFLIRRGIECKEIMKRSSMELKQLREEIWKRVTLQRHLDNQLTYLNHYLELRNKILIDIKSLYLSFVKISLSLSTILNSSESHFRNKYPSH